VAINVELVEPLLGPLADNIETSTFLPVSGKVNSALIKEEVTNGI
jgi:hypothetical protein